MGYLKKRAPVRVELGEGYWVDLKPRLSKAEMDHAKVHLSGYTVSDGVAHAKPDASSYQAEMVASSIVGWNLTDENDIGLLSVTKAQRLKSLQLMDNADFDVLVARVGELNQPASEGDQASFPDGSADGPSEPEVRPVVAEPVLDREGAVAERWTAGERLPIEA